MTLRTALRLIQKGDTNRVLGAAGLLTAADVQAYADLAAQARSEDRRERGDRRA